MPTYYDALGQWVPGRINFTAEATPNQVGSGWRALNTLFHEGGHAAHFANVVQNAPCFSQEYAPTSAAYAETQSMFCDSLLDDADWLARYARNADGARHAAGPDSRAHRQPRSRSWRSTSGRSPSCRTSKRRCTRCRTRRARLTRCCGWRATRSAASWASPARGRCWRFRICSTRSRLPRITAICWRTWRVYQTRAALLDRLGYLTDNPAIGPLLAEHYWGPGNSVDHSATLRSLTGEGLSARGLADACNQTVDEAWDEARASLQCRRVPQLLRTTPSPGRHDPRRPRQ